MYYPDQRFVTNLTTVNRQCLLPEDAIGNVQVELGDMVDIRDTVARGLIPDRLIIIDAVEELGPAAADDAKLRELMQVNLRTPVTPNETLAGRHKDRGRRVLAPVNGIVVHVGDGRIIMQEMPEFINLQAGVRGEVIHVYEGRGVTIETVGALVQGVWGNGRTRIAQLSMEPRGGITTLEQDELETAYRNEIVVTTRPITAAVLHIAEVRAFAGLIGPSMDITLIDDALRHGAESERAIMLTEGFGEMRMAASVSSVLQEFNTYNAALDAYQPTRWEPRRPELVVNRSVSQDDRPPQPDMHLPLKKGARVRITRPPHAGMVGKVINLPRQPMKLDNGLRVRCAEVDVQFGETIFVPYVNLELAGR